MPAAPRAVPALVFADHPEDRLRAGRTLRALAARGITAVDGCRLDPGAIAAAVDPARPLWLLRAGALPAHTRAPAFPPPSATGRPLCAFGAARPREGEREGPRASAWSALLARTGGDLAAPFDLDSPPIASLYLEPAAAQAWRARLLEGAAAGDAARALARDTALRRVRFPALDVHDEDALRVALAITSLQQGGAERVVLDLHHALTALGVEARVLTLGRPTRDAFPAPEGTIDLAARAPSIEGRIDALAAAAVEHGADLIHAHLLSLEHLARLATHRIPVVNTVHNTRPGWPAGFADLRPEHSALLIACSLAAEVDLVEAALPIPTRTIWNGIDEQRLRPSAARANAGADLRRALRIGETDLVLLAVANPRPQKRLHLLPALLASAQAELDRRAIPRRARLVLAGDPSPRHEQGALSARALRDAIAHHGVASTFHFAGSMADVLPALAAADALVSLSAHEGLSLAHLEALAAGLPVIATDAGGTRELAHANPAITVLPLETTPEEAGVVAVERALARPAGGEARVRADFSRAAMGARHVPLYRRAIAAHGPRAEGRGLLLITNNFSTGGAQSSARRLLTGLLARGERARAVVLEEQDAYPTPGRRALIAAGIPVHAVSRGGALDASHAVEQILTLIDDDRPRAVLCWNALAETKILLADRLLDVPLFDISPGEMYFASLERWLDKGRPALPYRDGRAYGSRLAGVIVKYEAEAARARAVLGAQVHVIPNGVDLGPRVARRPRGARLVIGTAARLSPQKRLDRLLAALRIAHPELPPYVLRIAGGPERGGEAHEAELRALAEGLPVEWLGDHDGASALLDDLDLFAMISEPAGCPNASLEAMARGLAVIATDVGGASEQVVDGVTGRLLGRDDVSGFAAALVALARGDPARDAMGAAGRARAEQRFDARRMVDDYARVCLGGP